MRIKVLIRSIRAYEQLVEAGAGMNPTFSDGYGRIYDDSHIACLPETVRTLLNQFQEEGLVEMSPAPPSSGSHRYLPTEEETGEMLRQLVQEQNEGKVMIEYFSHKGELKFVYREYVPARERIAGTSGIYEYIGTIPLAIQQHGEQMIKWYVEKTTKEDIAQQKQHDLH